MRTEMPLEAYTEMESFSRHEDFKELLGALTEQYCPEGPMIYKSGHAGIIGAYSTGPKAIANTNKIGTINAD